LLHAQAPVRSEPPSSASAADPSTTAEDQATAVEPRIIDLPAFDRIVLTAEAGGESIDVLPLDLPEGKIPVPFPTEGALSVQRVSEPSVEYLVSWSAIAQIKQYPTLILAEVDRQISAGDLGAAFDSLAYLHRYYPQVPGLSEASQQYLWRDAGAVFAAGRPDESLQILAVLYEQNPGFPRLANAAGVIGDRLVSNLLKEERYAAARAAVDSLQQLFPKLSLANVRQWRARFAEDANARMQIAREAFARRDFSAARAAVRMAEAMFPDVEGGTQLLEAIQREAPEMRVGVTVLLPVSSLDCLPTWEAVRTRSLLQPMLTQLTDFGSEGGIYRCAWGSYTTRDDGLQTTIDLSAADVPRQLNPAAVVLRLIRCATPGDAYYQPDFAGFFKSAALEEGHLVVVQWLRPQISPAALLQIPLDDLGPIQPHAAVRYQQIKPDPDGPPHVEYRTRTSASSDPENDQRSPGRSLVEILQRDEEGALTALTLGEVDVVDRVPPWLLEQARRSEHVQVGTYRLPTIHALYLNPENPLLEYRELRRALCYGIDREGFVRDILLGGGEMAGYRAISGPFSAGVSLGDPAGYAYNEELSPRPYEPRLASVLAGVAQAALAKRTAQRTASTQGTDQPPETATDAPDSPSASSPATSDPGDQDALAPPEPLRLAHRADSIARLACQTIKLQLDAAGIPIQLVELDGARGEVPFDLAYVELAVWDPIVDARRLLGTQGAAGRSTAFMNLALDQLSLSQNWNQAREQLKEIHRIARSDLPLIPLWQSVNHYAYGDWVQGIGERPVTLYQDLEQWQKRFTR
jgi:tetratricopeptide (TPR) repeat protein